MRYLHLPEQFMRWPIKRIAILALGLLCVMAAPGSATALDPGKAPSQYVHSTWRTDDGLPQNSVMKILQTRDGYLWVGTQAGIARFDGVRFTVFDHTNTPALHDDYVSDLVEDRQGTLWIATSHGGVIYFSHGMFIHLKGVDARSGLAIAADADGSVWIGGYGGLSHVRDGRVIKTYTSANGLSGDPVKRLVMDKDRSLWIATAGGLDRLAGGRIEPYSIKDGLPNNDVIGLHLVADGTLFVQTQNSDLARRVQGRFEPWKLEGLSGANVRDMLVDRNGNIWFASTTEGLVRIRDGKIRRFTAKDGLSGDQVVSLFEDRDGNLWVGTNGGGLDRFRDGSFSTYAKEEGLAADSPYAVIEDHAGDIWATTAAGLNQLHGNEFRVFTAKDGLPIDATSLWEDRAQNILAGSATHGLFRKVHGRFEQALASRDGIPPYLISAVFEDSKQQLWLATLGGGLVRRVDGRTDLYTKADGLRSNVLSAIAESADGSIWVGTNDGLNNIRDGRIKSFAANNGVSDAWIISLKSDSRNTLWIGTVGRGLYRLESGRFTHYSTAQGLPDDSVNSILEDADANLWIGTNKGIVRLIRRELDEVATGTSKTLQPLVFGKADGMKSSETSAGTQPTAWRARDGRLWFLTTRGLVVVDPARISFNRGPLPARIEEMLVDQVPVKLAADVRLAPGIRRLEIHYTAPNLSTPERTRFRYRLDGYDKQWVPGGALRLAQYTNLPPGNYTFHVGASGENGGWNAQEATLDFELKPYLYQTWWFRLLCGLAVLSIAWGAYRLRVNWLHARAAVLEERQRIASEIHDSLAQGLSGIIFQTEAALISMERAPNMTSAHLISARDLAKTSLDEARYSVWNLSPPVLEQKNLLESLSSMARQLARGRVDELDIHSSGTSWDMRPEAKHHVVLIAQEAISNAIQHGNAGTISINLIFTTDAMNLVVADDGAGFTPGLASQLPRRGYGMRNMRHRAERLGATLEVASEVGKGTQVSLCVPRLGRFARLWRRLRGKGIARIDG
jgi:ligand-binding sensor domain-containing protein/signal transduction histidine kinase